MSSPPTTPAPKSRKAAGASEDDIANELMILLIASNPTVAFNYKVMSAISGNMTACALEHRFRKLKAKAKDVREKAGDIEGLEPVKSTPKRKKSTTNEEGGDGDLESTKKRKNGANGASEAGHENGDSPVKKGRNKKGTAKVVKKEPLSMEFAAEAEHGDGESVEGQFEMSFEI